MFLLNRMCMSLVVTSQCDKITFMGVYSTTLTVPRTTDVEKVSPWSVYPCNHMAVLYMPGGITVPADVVDG